MDPQGEKERAGPSLRWQSIRGSFWTVMGHGGGQALRFASNLIMTRLLFPEAFGIMSLVQVVLQGLEMFSDIGAGPSVIRSKAGKDPRFLNTAWTIQVIRGAGLWGASILLAWPAARLYGVPDLRWMIPATGFAALVGGLGSPANFLLRKEINLKPLVIRDMLSQAAGIAFMIFFALFFHRSAWALVAGGLVRGTTQTVLSYQLLPQVHPRLCWNREAAKEILGFGRWILVSTALSYVLQQSDRAVLGGMISPAELGVYTMATYLVMAPINVLTPLTLNVLFPACSSLANNAPARLYSRLFQARAAIHAFMLPLFCILAIWGQQVVDLLYDPRYAGAGWMLRILAVGAIGRVVGTTGQIAMLALGDSLRYMFLQIVRCVLLVGGMLIGFHYWGLPGFVVGVTLPRFLDYPALVWAVRPHKVWQPGLDAASLIASAVVILGGCFLTGGL
ncbi:MAG: oligosaccharide flippase family protein [Phycisphaerae bacterium]|jgi:O-antigen/teichoic acid export membrane protein